MTSVDAALLINVIGFAVGIALYGMLALMVIINRRPKQGSVTALLLVTASLGLIWNAGELFVTVNEDLDGSAAFPFLSAAAYSALGFLPSVVVHSVRNEVGGTRLLAIAAYLLSIVAAVLHFNAAFSGTVVPSEIAFTALAVGAVLLAIGLIVSNLGQTIQKKAVWTAALLVFAVSGLHFVRGGEGTSWTVELVAHQASLPLALVILYQNYRFAFADLFLKRALSLILLAMLAFALYVWVAAPFLRFQETQERNDVQAIGLILVLWIATALAYPLLHRVAVWLVDKVILKRSDYSTLQTEIAAALEKLESEEDVIESVRRRLAEVLTAGEADWVSSEQFNGVPGASVEFSSDSAEIMVPTGEAPFYNINLGAFHGGRRLLSDETVMLESVAHAAARRIDSLRVTHARCEMELREQEFSKLAAEAQLTALRAQINPHFLFNALTTIGYLIRTSPEKAVQTLLQLTRILRSVLNATKEFSSLDEEMKLIESYLEIERSRFEERLSVNIDIPPDLLSINIPTLIIQPLVENAIKHGIAGRKDGGELSISASLESRRAAAFLTLRVSNTPTGKMVDNSSSGGGVGLNNVKERLFTYYGDSATFELDVSKAGLTHATIVLPVSKDPAMKLGREKGVSQIV
jgi:two-component system, LytTR family, sensor kinase